VPENNSDVELTSLMGTDENLNERKSHTGDNPTILIIVRFDVLNDEL
jgi:hypothetical protein